MNYLVAVFLALFSFNYSSLVKASASSETSLILIGDTGKNTPGQKSIAEAIKTHCELETCDLGILAGDNVYPAGVSSAKDRILEILFDQYYNPINIPFLVALGNHDYGKLSLSSRKASYQLQHAKRNPLFILPNYWYVKETPEAIFTVIDTTRLMWRRDRKIQSELVEKAYLKSLESKKWFFVVGHHPYLSNGTHGNAGRYENARFPYFLSGKYVKKFVEQNICGKAQFYLSGHDHSLQIIDGSNKNCDTIQIVSGSAAESTKLFDRNPALFQFLDLGYFQLNITHENVKIRALNKNNEVVYSENFSRK